MGGGPEGEEPEGGRSLERGVGSDRWVWRSVVIVVVETLVVTFGEEPGRRHRDPETVVLIVGQ